MHETEPDALYMQPHRHYHPPPVSAGTGNLPCGKSVVLTAARVPEHTHPVRPTTTAELLFLFMTIVTFNSAENHVVLSSKIRNSTPNSHLYIWFG